MKRTEPRPRFVACVNNKNYPASLELRNLYQVVADEAAAKHHQLSCLTSRARIIFIPKNISSLSSYSKPPRGPCCARQTSLLQNNYVQEWTAGCPILALFARVGFHGRCLQGLFYPLDVRRWKNPPFRKKRERMGHPQVLRR
jgi:hypothetical protein